MNAKLSLSAVVLFACASLICFAQDHQDSRRGGPFADMQRVFGTVESISPDKLLIKDRDGKSTAVKITPETQFRKDRQPARIEDIKAEDRVIAVGRTDKDGTFVAEFVATGQMRGGFRGGPGGMAGNPPSPEEMARMGLGTRFIAGEVKGVDSPKLTILQLDGQTQVIQADENTSFRNEKNESITLADIKVGDHIAGRGEVKNGVFVPEVLRVGAQFFRRAPDNQR